MAEEISDTKLTPATATATAENGGKPGRIFKFSRPKLRVTSEYDSETSVFCQKASCKLLDNLAKLKLSFQNNTKGEVSEPQVSFTSKYFSLLYDVEENDALVKAHFEIVPGFRFTAGHQVKAQQGEVSMVADLAGSAYKLEITSAVPFVGMPRASFKFPLGEFSVEEKEDEEEEEPKRALSVSGFLKSPFLNGHCTARYHEEDLTLRYVFKDENMTLIPRFSLPSNEIACAFKRRFSPSDKLSYWYHFDSDTWTTTYKHNFGKDYKFKAGYDSDMRLGWTSLWIGDEDGKNKMSPMKMKMQFMVQVFQDDIKSPILMFRMKKRWDI